MLPGFTTLVNAIGIPEMIPVPQSGPIKRSPLSWAFFFKRISSSSEILSEKENTCSPLSRAVSISGAVYSPGVENNAIFASGSCSNASSQVVTLVNACFSFLTDISFKNAFTSSNTLSTISSLSASTTIHISPGAAASASAVRRPALR